MSIFGHSMGGHGIMQRIPCPCFDFYLRCIDLCSEVSWSIPKRFCICPNCESEVRLASTSIRIKLELVKHRLARKHSRAILAMMSQKWQCIYALTRARESWKDYDAVCLSESYSGPELEILIDQGLDDSFFQDGSLRSDVFAQNAPKNPKIRVYNFLFPFCDMACPGWFPNPWRVWPRLLLYFHFHWRSHKTSCGLLVLNR